MTPVSRPRNPRGGSGGASKDGKSRFVELFEWKDGEASDVAHRSPQVMSIWEPMGALAEQMEFIELERAIE